MGIRANWIFADVCAVFVGEAEFEMGFAVAKRCGQFVEGDDVGRIGFNLVCAGATAAIVKFGKREERGLFALNGGRTIPLLGDDVFLHASEFVAKSHLSFGITGFGFPFNVDDRLWLCRLLLGRNLLRRAS